MTDAEQDYKIALAGTLPGEQSNGWEDLADDLHRDRARVRYARIAYNVQSSKEVTATGKKILTIQLLRIEPTDNNLADIDEMELRRMFEARTGQATLLADRDVSPGAAELDPRDE
jgi:hypothetical protein